MRYLLFTLLLCALVIPAFSEEIEVSTTRANTGATSIIGLSPIFAGKGETELIYDDGYTSGYGGWSQYEMRFGKWFSAGYPCWITGYKIYYYDLYGSADITNSFYNDEGGNPDAGTLLWSNGMTCDAGGWDWYTDMLNTPVYDADGGFYGLMVWDSTSEPGGPGIEPESYDGHNFRYYGSWVDWDSDIFIRAYVNGDVAAPYADGQDPADGEYNVEPYTDIVFHLKDDDIGVDIDTINENSVYVDAVYPTNNKEQVTGTITVVGIPDDYTVTFDPDTDFYDDAYVTVYLSQYGIIEDLLGNEMSQTFWVFVVGDGDIESASLGEIKAEFK